MQGIDGDFIQEFNFLRWAAHIRSKRRSQGWSLRDMQKIVKKSAVTISNWENCKQMPSVPDFLFVNALFDLTAEDYYDHDRTLPKTQLFAIASGIREWEV